MPLASSVARCTGPDAQFEVEKEEVSLYCRVIDSVDVQTPARDQAATVMNGAAQNVPFAVLEVDGTRAVKYLFYNKKFEDYVKGFGCASVDDSFAAFRQDETQHARLAELVARASRSGRVEQTNFFFHGSMTCLWMKCISRDPQRDVRAMALVLARVSA